MSGRKFVVFAAVIGMGVTGLRAEPMRFTRNESLLSFEASGEITLATPHDFMEAGVPRGATVSLDSPGGNVEAAMELGRLIRLRELQTEVAPGRGCASACVWAFAGGRDRIYRSSLFGPLLVHRFYGVNGDNGEANAQALVARISHYLDEMGVGHQLLEMALETPSETVATVPFDNAHAWGLDTFPAPEADGFRPALGGTPAEAAPQVGTPAPALTPQREAVRPAPVPGGASSRGCSSSAGAACI